MICYVLAMGKQHLGPHVVVGYGIQSFWQGLFITSSDHLVVLVFPCLELSYLTLPCLPLSGADPGEVKWVNFHPPPFSEPPSF